MKHLTPTRIWEVTGVTLAHLFASVWLLRGISDLMVGSQGGWTLRGTVESFLHLDDVTRLGILMSTFIIGADALTILSLVAQRTRPADNSTPDRNSVSPKPDGEQPFSPGTRPAAAVSRRTDFGRGLLIASMGLLVGSVILASVLSIADGFDYSGISGHSPAAISGAMILGVAMLFTGVVVCGFLLVIARFNANSSMTDDIADIGKQIDRADAHLAAIQRHRAMSRT